MKLWDPGGWWERASHGKSYFAGKRAKKALGKQADAVKGRIPALNEYFDSLLGQTEEIAGMEQKGLLDSFLNESYTFNKKSDTQQGQTGLAFSGEMVAEQDRQKEFARDQFINQQSIADANLEMEKLNIGKSREDSLQGIEDLLYRIQTEKESYV